MADNNIAILSLMASLQDNSKDLTNQAKKMISKVEENAGTVEFTGNTDEIKKAIKEINKLIESKLKGIDLTKQFTPMLKVFSDAESSAEDYLRVLEDVQEELAIISKLSSTTRNLMQNLSPKDSQKVLDEYKKLTKQQDSFAKKQEQARKKVEKIESDSILSLMREYKGKDEYEKAGSKERILSLTKQLGLEDKITNATKNEIKQYSQLLSIYNLLQKEKKELANIDTTEAAYKEVQINKNLLNITDELTRREKRFSSSFGAKNLESSKLEGFDVGEIERNTRSSIGKYVDIATKDFKITAKEINARMENLASEMVKASAEKMADRAEKAISESQAKLEKYSAKKSSTGETGSNDNLGQIGTTAQDVVGDVQKLDNALDNLGDGSDLDLWAKSVENLKDEFRDVIKYAVDAETALKEVERLAKQASKEGLYPEEQRDLIGYARRFDEINLDDDAYMSDDALDWIDTFQEKYEYIETSVSKMTKAQLEEIEKLKVAQKEVSETNITSSVTEKQVEETTEAVEKLAQAEKEVQEQTKRTEQELSDGSFINNEEIEKATLALKELQDVSRIKVDVDITEAVDNTTIVKNKLDELPEKKEIEIRVKDYSDAPYLTDPKTGKPTTLYRGTRESMSGAVGADQNGLSYYSTDKRVAESYIAKHGGKIITANGAMKNPLEIDVEGSHWDELTYIGEGFDETSKKLWDLKDSIDGYINSLNKVKKDSIEYKEITDKLNTAYAEQKKILADTSNPYVMNATTDEFADKVKASGLYDGLILKNIIDGGGITATDVVFFDEQQIRNAQVLNSELEETIQKKKEVNQIPLSLDSKTDEIAKETAMDVEQVNEKIIASNKEVVASEEAKEKVLSTDNLTPDTSSIDSEKAKLKELENAVSLVIEEIDRKTQAFHNEKAAVDMIIPSEIAKLEALESELITVRELLEQISKVPIDISFKIDNLDESTQKVLNGIKESLDGINPSSLGDISSVLEGFKISKSNVDNLQKLANAILTLKSNLNNVGNQGQQFLSEIKELIAQADGLKDLATVLKATKSQIANAKQGTKTPTDEESAKTKELAKDYDRLIVKLEKFNTTLNNVETKPKKTSAYIDEINDIRNAIDSINKLDTSVDIIDEDEIKNLELSISNIEKRIKSLNDEKFNLVDDDEINNLLKQGYKLTRQTAAPKELRSDVQAIISSLERMKDGLEEADRVKFNKLRSELKELGNQFEKTGKTGISIADKIKKKFGDVFAYFATYVSIQDFIQVFRQGFETIREYDTALTEMNKVSDESIQTLKEFQQESFKLADSVGTTASQIQNSTADWMRLGESLEEAKQSAHDANILLNVSEFGSIDEATESLVAMSAAYNELEKIEIVDIMNEIGNNYAISTDELSRALQRSAGTLKVAGNDIYEATALITAGNAVLQDAEAVGTGLKMISLRILGTEEAKDELASLGENVDDFVVQTKSKLDETIRDYTAVASNNFQGISVLDDNGNYKSTYEILRDISEVYQEILETDKKAGTNRGQALLEVLAGKNRSNVAASILSNPELLTSVYESAQNADGSALKENEAYLESIEGHLAQLKNAWDKLWINENNREVITFFLDLAKGILEAVDSFGVLNTLLVGGGGIFAAIKSFKGEGRVKKFTLMNMPSVA